MTSITVSKKIALKGDFVIIPRAEYEILRELQEEEESLYLTPAQERALRSAEKELKAGKALSIDELEKKLGFKN